MQDSVLSRLLIGGIVSFFVVWILQEYDNRLAGLYVFVVILLLLLTYREQLFNSINITLGAIKGSTNV